MHMRLPGVRVVFAAAAVGLLVAGVAYGAAARHAGNVTKVAIATPAKARFKISSVVSHPITILFIVPPILLMFRLSLLVTLRSPSNQGRSSHPRDQTLIGDDDLWP